MEDFIHIGYTQKAHGLNGEIKLSIKEAFWEDFDDLSVIFLKKGGTSIPYFIESVREGNAVIVKFEDVNDRTQARAIESKEIFARLSDLELEQGQNPDLKHLEYGHLIGFIIIDEELGELGTITDILEYPQQEMAVFDFRSAEQMLPLNPHFIIAIDTDHKKVNVRLPDGLLDL